MTKKRAHTYFLSTLIVLLALTSHQSFSQEITPETLFLTVYPDGFVFVNYTLLGDQTFPTLNLTVFGEVLEALLVVDADGLPLEYSLSNSTINVYSLGTTEISVTYLTQDLTSKEGRYWTLTLDSPINVGIILPIEATIISLNKVPDLIETNNDQIMLFMNSGLIKITYVIGIIGTREHAQIVLDDAETTITQIKSLDIIVTQAETKLQGAEEAFNLGNYGEAETLGNEAKNLAIELNHTATQAMSKISEAENVITIAENEGDPRLDDPKDLLDQAKSAYDLGAYSEALSFAVQAITKLEDLSFSPSESFPILEILGVIIILAAVVICLFFFKLRGKPKETKPKHKKRRIDAERIFRGHKDLMPEEKQAIQFLLDNNGEAFEAELYDYVKLPRTTTWRMVKRLKEMGIITVTKFRRQNLVRLKSKYDLKE